MRKLLLTGLVFIVVSLIFAEDEDQKCYWTDDCDRSCREEEYVAAESNLMMCSESKPCRTTPRHHHTNKLCCSIPKAPPSKWLPIMGLGPVCNVPGGLPCANVRGQQGFAECYWTEQCGQPCKLGEYLGAEAGRLTNERICQENEGVHRYCCKGPKIIWTTSD